MSDRPKGTWVRRSSRTARHPYRSVLVTGASSGIGRAVALAYAAPDIHLALTGRDAARLDGVAAEARSRGASVSAETLDVRARDAIGRWIRAIDDGHPIDLAVTGAGIATGLGMGRPREDPREMRAAIATNYLGVLNTVEPLVERMCARGRGRVALVGSLGGIRGVPYMPTYCATKAAIHVYAEGLRCSLAPFGVGVSLIIPGFVRTPMLENVVAPRPPLLMSPEKAARIIRRRLDRGAAVIAFPRSLYYGLKVINVLPRRLTDFAFSSYHVDIPESSEHDIQAGGER